MPTPPTKPESSSEGIPPDPSTPGGTPPAERMPATEDLSVPTPPSAGYAGLFSMSTQISAREGGPGNGLKKLDRFLLLEKFPAGGMGDVYKACDTTLNRMVALKMIRNGQLASERQIERFNREAMAVARLDHPNVIKLFDYGQVNGEPYLIMALAPGGSLSKQVHRFAGDPAKTVPLMSKIARAVQYVHEQGVLHRDLKPGNILLDAGDEPLISDFGLAKMTDVDVELTRTGEAPGTLAYMAPEQAGGRNREVGPYSDIWALGVMLYELLCGQKPFAGPSKEDIVSAILSTDPPQPSTVHKGLDPALEAIILKCLEKDPRRRYPSASALADALDRWQRGEERPPGLGARLARRVRKHPIGVSLGLGILLAALSVPVIQDYRDEERILKRNVYPKLLAGQPVTLIGATGPPIWYQKWKLPGYVSITPENDPTFKLESEKGKDSLLELFPHLPLDRFRIRAQVRFYPREDVGLYLGFSEQPEFIHSFIALHSHIIVKDKYSNPIFGASTLGLIGFPPEQACLLATSGLFPERSGGPYQLTKKIGEDLYIRIAGDFLIANTQTGTLPTKFSFAQKEYYFGPADQWRGFPHPLADWQEYKVEVTPDDLAFFSGGQEIGRISTAKARERSAKLRTIRYGSGMPAAIFEFAPQKGMGLYLGRMGVAERGSRGAFRNVVVEPF